MSLPNQIPSSTQASLSNESPIAARPFHSLSQAYQTYMEDDHEEHNHFEDVCRAYRQYATFAMQQWVNSQYRLHSLPEAQRNLLPAGLRQETNEFQERANAYKDAAIRNQFCLDCILRHAGQPHSQQMTQQQFSTDAQMSKVSSVLKSLARDWSSEGKVERDMAYAPLLKMVQKYLPLNNRSLRLCVPGAGVGRLACELTASGYAVQGNEFSLHMLLASDYILNGPLQPSTPLAISPYLLESRNVHSVDDPVRVVHIPDVDPFEMIMKNGGDDSHPPLRNLNDEMQTDNPSSETEKRRKVNEIEDESSPESSTGFSMAAGDFVSIYSDDREAGQWDGVVACFFLDASPNVVEYLLVIYRMLKPGGLLFNFGPLLWHWSGPAMRPDDQTVDDYHQRLNHLDSKYLTSIDLSLDDMIEILKNIGFEIIESSCGHPALYTSDRRSMVSLQYRCTRFVARKPKLPPQALK
ncbi:hypothetical protein FisN_6Hh290 [Fistulifera solaris]|uniref:carnosine N-methyltransferase n=1 Tax=Fistulifera solaris TaxID=1519565 RepID=A0A1Z5K6X9_FISSO|nr:hypothetical protein FisN_6Hh290 [Fistulifera solaris]|eukprot:GAX22043.1 hypothetical protein FisN_6Hh290 [Fistulifera solaris]